MQKNKHNYNSKFNLTPVQICSVPKKFVIIKKSEHIARFFNYFCSLFSMRLPYQKLFYGVPLERPLYPR